MRHVEGRGCWFAAGMLTGALMAAASVIWASRRREVSETPWVPELGPASAPPDNAAMPEAADAVAPAATVRAATAAGAAAPASVSPSTGADDLASGADMFEYRGFVIHLFWQALGPARYKAWCDIWEAGAVVQEAGGPPATYLTAAEARMAAGAWARHWVQNNG